MLNKNDVVSFNETRANTEKIANNFNKQKQAFRTVGNVGGVLSSFGGTVFVASLLSPFDFDGPIIEIVSGVVLVVGKIMKSIAKNKMDEIKVRETEDVDYYNFDYDDGSKSKSR